MQRNEEEKGIALRVIRALVDTVREAGERGAPSGICFLAFQSVSMSLDSYARIVGILVEAGELFQSNHVLYHRDFVPCWMRSAM